MKRNKYKLKRKPVARNCSFCDNKVLPNYKETDTLYKFLTERGKIIGKSRTGICSKHHRILTRELKKARYLSLLPYVVKA